MDPINDMFFWPDFMRKAGFDKFSEKNIKYPVDRYFKGKELSHDFLWLLAKNRKHKMFIRKCGDIIEPFEECIENLLC